MNKKMVINWLLILAAPFWVWGLMILTAMAGNRDVRDIMTGKRYW